MNSHTPPPWRAIQGGYLKDDDPTYWAIEGGRGFYRDDATTGFTLTGFMRKEDALLAISAPILLDALILTAGNIRSCGPAGALGPVHRDFEVWLAVVDAAIAAAVGGAHVAAAAEVMSAHVEGAPC